MGFVKSKQQGIKRSSSSKGVKSPETKKSSSKVVKSAGVKTTSSSKAAKQVGKHGIASANANANTKSKTKGAGKGNKAKTKTTGVVASALANTTKDAAACKQPKIPEVQVVYKEKEVAAPAQEEKEAAVQEEKEIEKEEERQDVDTSAEADTENTDQQPNSGDEGGSFIDVLLPDTAWSGLNTVTTEAYDNIATVYCKVEEDLSLAYNRSAFKKSIDCIMPTNERSIETGESDQGAKEIVADGLIPDALSGLSMVTSEAYDSIATAVGKVTDEEGKPKATESDAATEPVEDVQKDEEKPKEGEPAKDIAKDDNSSPTDNTSTAADKENNELTTGTTIPIIAAVTKTCEQTHAASLAMFNTSIESLAQSIEHLKVSKEENKQEEKKEEEAPTKEESKEELKKEVAESQFGPAKVEDEPLEEEQTSSMAEF